MSIKQSNVVLLTLIFIQQEFHNVSYELKDKIVNLDIPNEMRAHERNII